MHSVFHLAQRDCQAMAALHRGVTVFHPDFLRIGFNLEIHQQNGARAAATHISGRHA